MFFYAVCAALGVGGVFFLVGVGEKSPDWERRGGGHPNTQRIDIFQKIAIMRIERTKL